MGLAAAASSCCTGAGWRGVVEGSAHKLLFSDWLLRFLRHLALCGALCMVSMVVETIFSCQLSMPQI